MRLSATAESPSVHVFYLIVLDVDSSLMFISSFQDPLPLDRCIVCCEPDWEDYFEIQEFVNKESFVFKVRERDNEKYDFQLGFRLIFHMVLGIPMHMPRDKVTKWQNHFFITATLCH